MKISKRQFITGAAAASGLLVAAGAARDWRLFTEVERVKLAMFDGRSDVARDFAAQASAAGIRTVDIRADEEGFWRRARSGFGLGANDKVIGVTSWDDWVTLRAQFAQNRMRVRSEIRLDCCEAEGAGQAHDLLRFAAKVNDNERRLAVVGQRGTLFAWQVA